jgi:hypothetical protein
MIDLKKVLLLASAVVVWASWIAATVLLYQANHHFARGPMVPTGEYTGDISGDTIKDY